jgi:hypothetical protein
MPNEIITPRKAIRIGQLLVNFPVMIIMLSVAVGLYFLSNTELIHPLVFLPGSFLFSPLLAWVYWSFAITHWRIWAFSRIDDPIELKVLAVESGLIWSDSSFFEKTEIRTSKQKAIIIELEKRIKEERSKKFKDDPSIPRFSEFKNSKSSIYAKLFQNVLIIVAGAYFALTDEKSYIGWIFVGIGILFSIRPLSKLSILLPILTISNEGIIVDEQLYNWNQIKNESAQMKGIGKRRSASLSFEIDGIIHQIPLDDYDVTLPILRKLLKIYRGRYTFNNNSYE